jgi:hypothetical protein
VPIHDPMHDDRHFEQYLKQFRPLAPEELPTGKYRDKGRDRRARGTLVLAWAAVAAIVISALLILYPDVERSGPRDEGTQWAGVPHAGATEPLTIQLANAQLTQAPSFKAAVDAMAIPTRTFSFTGEQSALDVLSKDSKL